VTADDERELAAAALRRSAFLLERAQASRYRSAAFRTAVATVEGTDPDRFAALVRAGAVADLPGLGPRTAQVAEEAARGQPVPYLDDLEAQATTGVPPSPEAVALRAALLGDLHSHTEASDGTTSVQEMVLAALELGHEYLAVTDHSPRLTVAHGLSAERLRAQRRELAALGRAVGPFRVLSGIEVDVLDDGSLDQEPALLDELDVVVASVHSNLAMEPRAMTRRLVAAVSNPRTDVLGHCTGRKVTGRGRPQSRFDHVAVFDACAAHGVAVEINCSPDRVDPPDELLVLARDAGCLFSLDSDAHAPGELDRLLDGCERAVRCGITADRIVTTLTADELLARPR
jgi:putative hydrolase